MFSLHNHTGVSSASRGFADSSIKLEDLINKSKELGLNGVAVTDHESIGAFVKCKQLEDKNDYSIICGNEIYLVSDNQYETLKNDYQSGMYFPHFLLLAKDIEGNKQLRELSSIAWENNAFMQSGLFRTPTKMSDIQTVIGNNKGHIIASTACLGGQVSRWILDILSDDIDEDTKKTRKVWLDFFINWCQDIFGKDNFYLECQPASDTQEEQIKVNDYILQLSKETNVPYIITTDSHYLSKDLFSLHNSFLNSSEDSDREVEAFYKTAYLMGEQEVIEYFLPYWDIEDIQKGLDNTDIIGKQCERYSLAQKQKVPKIKFDEGWKVNQEFFPKTEYIQKYINSPYEDDRYTMYKLEQQIKKIIIKDEYAMVFDRLESELEEIWEVSSIINDRLISYFITMSKLIEIIWTEGDSLVCPGRGSGVSSIINYLMEITQVNPLKMPIEMPFYRFISRERAEMADC